MRLLLPHTALNNIMILYRRACAGVIEHIIQRIDSSVNLFNFPLFTIFTRRKLRCSIHQKHMLRCNEQSERTFVGLLWEFMKRWSSLYSEYQRNIGHWSSILIYNEEKMTKWQIYKFSICIKNYFYSFIDLLFMLYLWFQTL